MHKGAGLAAARFATFLQKHYRLLPTLPPGPRISPPHEGFCPLFLLLAYARACFDSVRCQKGRRPAASPRAPLWHIRFAYSCVYVSLILVQYANAYRVFRACGRDQMSLRLKLFSRLLRSLEKQVLTLRFLPFGILRPFEERPAKPF